MSSRTEEPMSEEQTQFERTLGALFGYSHLVEVTKTMRGLEPTKIRMMNAKQSKGGHSEDVLRMRTITLAWFAICKLLD